MTSEPSKPFSNCFRSKFFFSFLTSYFWAKILVKLRTVSSEKDCSWTKFLTSFSFFCNSFDVLTISLGISSISIKTNLWSFKVKTLLFIKTKGVCFLSLDLVWTKHRNFSFWLSAKISLRLFNYGSSSITPRELPRRGVVCSFLSPACKSAKLDSSAPQSTCKSSNFFISRSSSLPASGAKNRSLNFFWRESLSTRIWLFPDCWHATF